MKKIGWMVAMLALVTTPMAVAGGSKLSIGLGQGTADGYGPVTVGAGSYLAPTTAPETNAGVEYWYAFNDDYAFALSGVYGFTSMT
jgi:hypothetical protein